MFSQNIRRFKKYILVLRFILIPSFATRVLSLKVTHSDKPIRPHFHNRTDAFSTPSSTPQTPASWPPRHDSTRVGQICVTGHVVSFFTPTFDRTPQTPCHGTRRDVPRSVSEGVVDSRWSGGVCLNFGKSGHTFCKHL